MLFIGTLMEFNRLKNSVVSLAGSAVELSSSLVGEAINNVADRIDSANATITKQGNRMNVDLSKVSPVENGLTVNLSKGENVKLGDNLKQVVFGLEWDPVEGTGDFDADASIVQLDENGKAIDFVFFRKLESSDGAILHTGDNLTGEDTDEADDASIAVDLEAMDPRCARVVILAEIFQANSRGQNFGQVSKCGVRLYDLNGTNEVLAKHDLTEDHATAVAINVGELYRHDGGWKFKAVGTDNKTGIAAFLKDYGINA